jgi:hypothetical protein
MFLINHFEREMLVSCPVQEKHMARRWTIGSGLIVHVRIKIHFDCGYAHHV